MRIVAAAGAVLFLASTAYAEQAPLTVPLVLKDHRFSPATFDVPAGRKVRIELTNLDGTAEEFDSTDLHIETNVAPHGKAAFQIGPLQPGSYAFTGELHATTASGTVTVVPAL